MAKEIRFRIAKRIKELRKQKGLTQEELADRSGVAYKHIQKLESKTPYNAQINTLEKIAKAFKISVSEFLKF